MLIDSHCHLDFPDFDADRDAMLDRARAAGVEHFLTISTRLSTFARVRDVAGRYDDVHCTLGVHPHHAAEEADAASLQRLVALAADPKVAGIGETGLDYYYDTSPRDVQQASFRTHIQACLETGLPLIVHTREADADTMRILREEATGAGLQGILHCFSSGRALAEAAVAFGFHVSFSGILTFKKSEELRAIARDLPAERLLVETDAPYLAPVPHRGHRNEPGFVVHTAAMLAEVKSMAPDALAAATTANFRRLFGRVGVVGA